jgi:hypothetical protein
VTTETDDVIRIQINLKINSAILQTIVTNAKKSAGCDAQGRYHVDTADKVGELISRFLENSGFAEYAADIGNYDINTPP